MITQQQEQQVKQIIEFLEKDVRKNPKNIHQNYAWIEGLQIMVANLKIAPQSYRYSTPQKKEAGFVTTLCLQCGWWGCGSLLKGGEPITDSGDCEDALCPVCYSTYLDEKEEPAFTQP